MTKKIDLIILPMHDWKKCEAEGFRTRDAHLMQHFEHNEHIRKILVIDRPISIPEMILMKRRWRVKNGNIVKRMPSACISQISDKTYVLDIFSGNIIKPLMLKQNWWDHIFRQEKILRRITEAADYLKLQSRILFLWSPLSTGVIGCLQEEFFVFDALDNWAEHPGMINSRERIIRGYEVIKKNSNLMFANAESITEFLKNDYSEVIYIPNGVDLSHFDVSDDEQIPNDIKNIPKPLIGYGGKLEKRIDVSLIDYIANKMPQASFVFIGPFLDRKWMKPLFGKPNIYFLGDKHYNIFPKYISALDVCIIPHIVGGFDADHIKLYEYLAAGKPVVSTGVVGANIFKDIITIANSREEFWEGIKYYLSVLENDSALSERLRNSIPESCFWKTKADFMIEKIIELFGSEEE